MDMVYIGIAVGFFGLTWGLTSGPASFCSQNTRRVVRGVVTCSGL